MVKQKPSEEHLTPFEQQCVDKLKALCRKQNMRELDFYWELGAITANVYKEAETLGKDYDFQTKKKMGLTGPQRVELIAKEVQLHPKTLLEALRVYERWETKEKYEELIEAASHEGKVLTFAHIKELSRLDNDNIVFSEARRAVKEGLSTRELQLKLKGMSGKGPSKKGRTPKVPNNLEACITSMRNHLSSVLNKVNKVWFGDDYNLLEQLDNIDPEFFNENPEFCDNLAEVASLMHELGSIITHKGEALSLKLEEITEMLNYEPESESEPSQDSDD